MTNTFAGFPREGLDFLRDLAENNDREWFAPRKAVYEEKLKAPMIELVAAVHREMVRFAPDYVGEPAKSLYRIYRDTRFSKDKTPYKTHVGALMWRNGMEKGEGAAYYIGISAKKVEVAGGLYSPDPGALAEVRRRIAGEPAAFRATFESPRVRKLAGELQGETLSRVPKGFDASDPAAELLKRKRFFLCAELDADLASGRRLLPEIVKRLEAMAPFVDYLDGPLAARGAKQRREERFLR